MDLIFTEIKTVLVGFVAIGSYFAVIIGVFIWRERRRRLYTPFSEDMCRLPGHTLRRESENHSVDVLVWLLSGLFMLMWLCRQLYSTGLSVLIALLTIAVAFSAYKTLSAMHRYHTTTKGLRGEEYTGQELNFLMRDGAYVFHDIPYKYGNIDHVVVCQSRILAVETKAYSKPQNRKSQKREYEVSFDGESLKIPGHSKADPAKQAHTHAAYLRELIKKQCGVDYPVTPVVALPGWMVPNQGDWNLLVLNPKRARPLRMRLFKEKEHPDFKNVVVYVEKLARSVPLQRKVTDPDAHRHFDFWLKRKRIDNE